jgi:WD40 repeat protein
MKLKIGIALLAVILALAGQHQQSAFADAPNLAVITSENIQKLIPYAGFSSTETKLLLSVGFDANSHLLALYSAGDMLELRDLQTNQLLVSHKTTFAGDVYTREVMSSPSGRTAAVWLNENSSTDGVLRIFNTATGTGHLIKTVAPIASVPFAISWDDQLAAFFDDLTSTQGSKPPIVITSLSTDRVLKHLYLQSSPGNELTFVTSLVFSPDNHFLYAGTGDGKIVKWDNGTLRQVETYAAPDGITASLSISPHGDLMLAADCVKDELSGKLNICTESKFVVWSTQTHKTLLEIARAHEIPIVTFSPDGKTIAMFSSGSDTKISLWGVLAESKPKIDDSYVAWTPQ